MRPGFTSRGLRALWLVLAVYSQTVLVAARPAMAANDNDLELAVKATYLYKLAPFVRWPDEVCSSPTSPFYICIAGKDPFGAILDSAVDGQNIDQHAITIRRLSIPLPDAHCHILYIGVDQTSLVAKLLTNIRGTPVLTVTDSMTDGAAKGIVNFVIVDNRVRFEIDREAAAQGDLQLSSKLIILAVSQGKTLKASE